MTSKNCCRRQASSTFARRRYRMLPTLYKIGLSDQTKSFGWWKIVSLFRGFSWIRFPFRSRPYPYVARNHERCGNVGLPPQAVKNGTPPQSITVCVLAPGKRPFWSGCGRGLPPLSVGVRFGVSPPEKVWHFRCKFCILVHFQPENYSCDSAKYHTYPFHALLRAAIRG